MIPNPIMLLSSLTPSGLQATMLAGLLNHFVAGQSLRSGLSGLEGKRLCLRLTDLRREYGFLISQQQIQHALTHATTPWDVRISGTLSDLLCLICRHEDPDTLFFNRRLCIEGETETGLYLKNLIDGMEFDWKAHIDFHLGPRLSVPLVKVAEKTHAPDVALQLINWIVRH